MKNQASVSLQGNTMKISGALCFDSVAELKQQLDKLPHVKIQELDCSDIVQSDSSAVSLLLYLLRDNSFVLQGVNRSLQGLLDLYDVSTFFSH